MTVIGITGGVGAGKTRILSVLKEEFLAETLICDQIADKLMKKGQPAFEALVDLLGEEYLGTEGELDKYKLSTLIFSDEGKQQKKEVEKIVHPLVRQKLEEIISTSKNSLIAIESAILIEAGLGSLCDQVWYIHADKNTRVKRLQKEREYSIEKAKEIIEAQLVEEEFREKADYVIDNSISLSVEMIKQRIRKGLQQCL